MFTTQKNPAQSNSPTASPMRSMMLQRKCACGGSASSSGECESCKKKKAALQRAPTLQAAPNMAPPIVHEALRSPGQPLDGRTRAFFEPRFGHDFSRVRIHADRRAAESAQAVNAFAYTVGHHIFFAPDRFAPGTREGSRLLAHELTHTVQQSSGGMSYQEGSPLTLSDPKDAREQEANAVARALSQPAGIGARGVAGSVSRSVLPVTLLQRACTGSTPTTCTGSCTTSTGKLGKCIFNSMPRWCKCLDTSYFNMIPAWLLALLGAAAITLIAACFATGVCEFGAVVAGLGTAAAAALMAILRAAGVQDSGSTLAAASGSTGDSQPDAGSQAASDTTNDNTSSDQAA